MAINKCDVLQPIPTIAERKPAFRIVRNVLSGKQCDRILNTATNTGRTYRSSAGDGKWDVRYLAVGEAQWLYSLLGDFFAEYNEWQFSLSGILDPVRILHYGRGDYVGLHNDVNYTTGDSMAKLTAVIPLTSSSLWGGGESVIGTEQKVVRIGKGNALIFPSFVLHEVTRISRGKRAVLAAWASGPPFV